VRLLLSRRVGFAALAVAVFVAFSVAVLLSSADFASTGAAVLALAATPTLAFGRRFACSIRGDLTFTTVSSGFAVGFAVVAFRIVVTVGCVVRGLGSTVGRRRSRRSVLRRTRLSANVRAISLAARGCRCWLHRL
jgi:hypothetical protein